MTLFKDVSTPAANAYAALTLCYQNHHGKKLFAGGTIPSNLKLTKHAISGTGVIITTYVPDGEIKTGSFALDEPNELEIKRREGIA